MKALFKLSDQEDLNRIRDIIANNSIEVVIVDPLYLTLLAGTRDVSASPGHHFKKTVGRDDTDLDLDDFSFVGAAEFARQSPGTIYVTRRIFVDPPVSSAARSRAMDLPRR